jgi:MFS family permease
VYAPTVSPRRERIFYGWWVVAAGFGLEALIGSLFFYAYGAYVVLLREEFGWSRTLLSAAFALARAESAVLGPIQGWLTDRFGPRVLIRTGMVVLGLGFMLFSLITGPVTFSLVFFVMAVGAGLGGYLPITVAIVNWFRRRRAQALAFSSVGMAMGGLMTPLVAGLMLQVGWRWTAFLSGVLIILAGLPLAQLMRHRPEAYGWRARRRRRSSLRVRPCARAPSGSSPRATARPCSSSPRSWCTWSCTSRSGSASRWPRRRAWCRSSP